MKAITRTLALLITISTLLAACGGASTAQPTAAPAGQATAAPAGAATAAPAAQPTTAPAGAATTAPAAGAVSPEGRTVVRFWYGLGGQIGEVIESQIAKYNTSQNEIFVEGVFQQSYNGVQEKFQAALVSGDVPEVVQIEIHATPKFASAGALTPLEEFYKNDPEFNFDDLVPAGLLNQSWDGQLYAMPINRSTPVLYYNKELFRAAGLDPDKPPTTWQEFREAAKALTKVEGGETTVHGFLAGTSWWYFESLVWGNGGEIMTPDVSQVTFAEKGAAPLQVWGDMIHVDETARFFTGDKAYDQTIEAFATGKGGMMFQSTASLGAVTRAITEKGNIVDLGTAFVPHMDGFGTAVPTGGAAAGIPTAVPAEKKQAAWEFIKWWISAEENAIWSAATGYFPIRQSSIEILEEQGYYSEKPYYRTTIEQLQFAREAPLTPFWPAISKEINVAMDEVMLNNVPAAEALAAAQERAQEAVEE
jgi:sn-glycerol 3-phosphate transport system substrate-binding protein